MQKECWYYIKRFIKTAQLINASKLAKGVNMIKMNNGGKVTTKEFVKQ